MDIRINKCALHTTASQDLNIEEDLLKQDQSLTETIKAYEENSENTENEKTDS